MYRATNILALVLFGTSMVAMAGDSDASEIRAEIVAKADSLFRQRYTPRPHTPLRTFDKDRESRPADATIYWFNATYVVRLVFGTDGSLVRVELFPEGLLYSDSWTSVPDTLELSRGEMRWVIAVASQLRPTGAPCRFINRPMRASNQAQICIAMTATNWPKSACIVMRTVTSLGKFR